MLVKFNIPSLPEGVEILDAYLELHIYSIEHYVMNLSRCLYIQVHRLTEDWNEDEVTWNRRTATEYWNNIGGSISLVPSIEPVKVDPSQGFVKINIKTFVEEWVKGYYPNYGLLIKLLVPKLDDYSIKLSFYTKEEVLMTSKRPHVTIKYEQEGNNLTTSYVVSADTYISSSARETNYGSMNRAYVMSERKTIYRALIQFDLSDLSPSVKVNSAILRLRLESFGKPFEGELHIFRVTRPWRENEVTWKKANATAEWSQWGGDFSTPEIVYRDVGSSLIEDIDITEIVKGWVSGEYPNYGIILVLYVKVFSEKEYCPSAPQFSYYAVGSRESFTPKLIVTYEEPSLEVSSTPNGNTVRRGETAFYTIEVKSYVYTGNIELSLSGLPSGTT